MVTNDANAARTEVMAVLDRRVEAVRAKDIDRIMSLYSPGIVYFDIIPPQQFVGAGELRRNSCGGSPSTRATLGWRPTI